MKFKIGRLYEIYFMDHSIGLDSPFMCRVPGYVIEDNRDHVKITTWEVVTDDQEVKENNRELVCIMKCNIKRKRIL
jgi:hypothetical protein